MSLSFFSAPTKRKEMEFVRVSPILRARLANFAKTKENMVQNVGQVSTFTCTVAYVNGFIETRAQLLPVFLIRSSYRVWWKERKLL